MERTRQILIMGAIAIGLVLAIQFLVYWLVPVQRYARIFARRVSVATGAEVLVSSAHLALFPRPTLQLRDVSIRRGSDTAAPPFAHIPQIDLNLAAAPLLRGDVTVHRLFLYGPKVEPTVSPTGDRNWRFTAPGAPRAHNATPAAGDSGPGLTLRFDAIEIMNGELTYTDARDSRSMQVTGVHARIIAPDIDGPFHADGAALWKGHRVRLSLKAQNAHRFAQGERTTVDITAGTDAAELSYQGHLQTRNELAAAGTVQMRVAPLPPHQKSLLHATGTLRIAAGHAELTDAVAGGDMAEARGRAILDWRGERPQVDVYFATELLDLTSLISPAGPDPKQNGDTEATQQRDPLAPDLLWLDATDGNAVFFTEQVALGSAAGGYGEVVLDLQNGALSARLSQTDVHGGSLSASVLVQHTAKTAEYGGTVEFAGLALEPTLLSLTPKPRVTGTAATRLRFAGRGRTTREMLACMNGYGSVTIRDGTLRGVDLAAVTGNIARTVWDNLARNDPETPFKAFTATFMIEDGVMYTDDARLQAGLLALQATGRTHLVQRTVAYDAVLRRPWLRVPLRLTGPWSKIQVQTFAEARTATSELGPPSDATSIYASPDPFLDTLE